MKKVVDHLKSNGENDRTVIRELLVEFAFGRDESVAASRGGSRFTEMESWEFGGGV